MSVMAKSQNGLIAGAAGPSGSVNQDGDIARPWAIRGMSVYLIGIGGCGMSGLARMVRARGAAVSGSDKAPSSTTAALEAEGIAVGLDQSREWLPESCDLVIASAAVKPDHPQMLEAQHRGIPTLTYAEALGRCMIGWTGVAIAGTHGKSTTTAMLGATLADAGLDPTVIVGATCAQLVHGSLGEQAAAIAGTAMNGPAGFRLGAERIPAGALAGQPGILIAEACEFNRSFHNYRPLIGSISAVEADHLDVYGTFDAVVQAFHEFAKLIAPASQGGRLLIAHDGAHRKEVTAGLACQVETIGYAPAADWVVTFDPPSRRVTLGTQREKLADWTMLVPGAHNALNAATAAALAIMLGADPAKIGRSLSSFRGVDRRTQFLGERPNPMGGAVRVYDDYGHHPTEVDTTLRALRDFERPDERGGRLICVFQPHQHSRTRFLLDEFVSAFSAADVVIVPHIYFVRDSEAEKQKISATDLVDRLRARGVHAMHLYPFEAIVEQLENTCRPGDLLVVMGAGPVNEVALGYLKAGVMPPTHDPRAGRNASATRTDARG
jgi:UDP-N-acetylmuramate--alanine ligase